MKITATHLTAEYEAAIRECLAGRGEIALERAYEAGRQALAEGLGVLEMAAAHAAAVRSALREAGISSRDEMIVHRALECFAESLSPFEMVLRGVRESNVRLQASVQRLVCAEEELRRQNQKLTGARDAIEKERRRYQALFDFAPDAYLVTEFDTTIREANAAAAIMLGMLQDQLPGRSFLDFIAPSERDAARNRLWQLQSNGFKRIEEWQLSIQPAHGPGIPGAATVAAERDSGALKLRWLIRDVSERKRQEEVIAERDKAKEASRAKDEFLAILSHELRNPLMPVIGWARMLKGHTLASEDAVLAEGLRSLERNAQILGRLVGDCLDMSRIAEGKIELERRPVELNEAIRGASEDIQEAAANKELLIKTELSDAAILVLADPTRIEQVIMNLLVNAVKYTDEGGEVVISCRSIDGEAEIVVRDTGIGMHPAFLEDIFEPFRRGAGSRHSHESGLGLGLAIARRIVEMHGGRIWAESAGLDCGSSFHVRLPMAGVSSAQTASDLHCGQIRDASRSLRILLIEDSDDILFLLKIEMERAGHTVITATDGSTGLALARTNRPDLILSDIKMPRMDGYELIRQVRATPEIRDTPAIALTGLGAKPDVERAIAAGFDACVMKPAEAHEISALIDKLTKREFQLNPERRREPQ